MALSPTKIPTHGVLMALFEVTWPDAPSLLISATSTGRALQWVQRTYGPQSLFSIQDIFLIEEESFLLVQRDGWIDLEQHLPPFRFCPEQSSRCFLVHHHDDPQRKAVFVVDHLSHLPALILWHFEILDEAAVCDESTVLDTWEARHNTFHLLEIDTETEGILLLFQDAATPSEEELDAAYTVEQ